MSHVVAIPRDKRHAIERKPRHGAACNNCGLCCLMTLCDLGRAVYRRDRGPCPALQWDGPVSSCKLAALGPPALNDAARVIIRAGEGCDCRINGEATDTAFHRWQDQRDVERAGDIAAARKLWGLD